MTHQISFSLPNRNSTLTGSTQIVKEFWKTAEKRKVGSFLKFDFDLVKVKELCDQPLFTSQPWTAEAALRAIIGGGWFDFRNAEFESPETRQFALDAQELFKPLEAA